MSSDISALDQQIAELQKRRGELISSQRREALSQVKTLIKQFGFSANEIGLAKTKAGESKPSPKAEAKSAKAKDKAKPKSKVKAKYANPENPSQTWSGRGISPKWVADYVAKGGNKDDLLIK